MNTNLILASVAYQMRVYGALTPKVASAAGKLSTRQLLGIATATDEPTAYRNAARICLNGREYEIEAIVRDLQGLPF